MTDIIMDYFNELFTTSSPSAEEMENVLGKVNLQVDEDMNDMLCRPFTTKEVKRALFDMNPDKAPGPDGMPTLFIEILVDCWETVMKEVLHVLNNGGDLSKWNGTIARYFKHVDVMDALKLLEPLVYGDPRYGAELWLKE
ncbi:hypothetical protein DH2020_024331 [Rehmannia glutinosa]|uniref:Uncharacterized protein n=1 Tax=Rehmannia glutinosa TaxID=99300 RepID=A0ABR0W2P0_REHGL